MTRPAITTMMTTANRFIGSQYTRPPRSRGRAGVTVAAGRSTRLTRTAERRRLRGVPVEFLPVYRVTARNTSIQSENRIHDDETARRYGFRGGLVPGVTVYAYLTHPLTSFFGRAWLERGTATVRFVKPIFEGDSVIVSGSVTGRDGAGVSMSLSARVERGEEACVGKETGRAEREEECAV